MLLGVWAVANMTGHALGSLMGGVIVDSIHALTGNAFIGYATLFGFEMAILFAPFILSFQLKVESSLAREEERSIMLLEAAAD